MERRQGHRGEVIAFLDATFGRQEWRLGQPPGTGQETYVARADGTAWFVKLGTPVARVRAAAVVGLTPPVRGEGTLADGTPVLVQPYVEGRHPRPADFQAQAAQVAARVHTLHHDP